MKKHVVFDKNAHIADLISSVDVINGKTVACVSFRNTCDHTITAIKLKARAYDAFGDVVCINGKEDFLLVIQDIHIPKGGCADKLKVILANQNIRKLVLEECQICLLDGSICTYEGKNIVEYDIETIDDPEKRIALKEYTSMANNMPLQLDDAWVCLCGKYNSNDVNLCAKCKKAKENVFSVVTDDHIAELSEKRRKRLAESQAEAERQAEVERREKKRGLTILVISMIAIFAIAITAVVLSVVKAISPSKSETTTTTIYKTFEYKFYESKDEMKAALQGVWKCYADTNIGYREVVREVVFEITINGDTCDLNMQDDKVHSSGNITWYPKRACFTVEFLKKYEVFGISYTNAYFTVMSDGTLEWNGF
jgi:hypothetical protein